jgi:hypothetical protein
MKKVEIQMEKLKFDSFVQLDVLLSVLRVLLSVLQTLTQVFIILTFKLLLIYKIFIFHLQTIY